MGGCYRIANTGINGCERPQAFRRRYQDVVRYELFRRSSAASVQRHRLHRMRNLGGKKKDTLTNAAFEGYLERYRRAWICALHWTRPILLHHMPSGYLSLPCSRSWVYDYTVCNGSRNVNK